MLFPFTPFASPNPKTARSSCQPTTATGVIARALRLACSLLLGLSALGCQARQVDVHDPVMTREGDTYYLFSTGPGITIYSSPDRIHWTHAGRAFADQPSWAKSIAPSFDGHLWAPDIHFHDGKFYLYYSVSAFGKNTSAIGLTINKTLNPTAPDYHWEDQGIVIESVPNRDLWNAIDPAVIVDKQGTPWMTFGSFWDGIKMFKLNSTWSKPAEPEVWYSLAKRERAPFTPDTDAGNAQIEGPFIFHKGDYYYLFVSYGLCCRGPNSTYHVMVGRAKSATGPYLDKTGKDMNQGGGSLVIKGNERWQGLGHNGAYTWDGKDYLVLHAYETADHYLQKVKILRMQWDKNDWPVVDPKELDSYQSELMPGK